MGHNSQLENESDCEKEYRGFCLNGGERYYLIDQNIVGCNGYMEENDVKSTCGGLR